MPVDFDLELARLATEYRTRLAEFLSRWAPVERVVKRTFRQAEERLRAENIGAEVHKLDGVIRLELPSGKALSVAADEDRRRVIVVSGAGDGDEVEAVPEEITEEAIQEMVLRFLAAALRVPSR